MGWEKVPLRCEEKHEPYVEYSHAVSAKQSILLLKNCCLSFLYINMFISDRIYIIPLWSPELLVLLLCLPSTGITGMDCHAVLGIELRIWYPLGKHPINWASPPPMPLSFPPWIHCHVYCTHCVPGISLRMAITNLETKIQNPKQHSTTLGTAGKKPEDIYSWLWGRWRQSKGQRKLKKEKKKWKYFY